MFSEITNIPKNKTYAVGFKPEQLPILNRALVNAGLPTFGEDEQVFIIVRDQVSIIYLATYVNGRFYSRIILDCQKPLPAVVRCPVWDEDYVEVSSTLLLWWKFNILTHLINAKGPLPESCVKFDALVYDELYYPGSEVDPWKNKIVTNSTGGVMILINTQDPADRYYLAPFDPEV